MPSIKRAGKTNDEFCIRDMYIIMRFLWVGRAKTCIYASRLDNGGGADMKTEIKVKNIQCVGCARAIGKEIGIIPGVYGINVDIANKMISVDHTEEISLAELKEKLKAIGYPVNDK